MGYSVYIVRIDHKLAKKLNNTINFYMNKDLFIERCEKYLSKIGIEV